MSSGRHIGWLGPIWDGFVVASLLDSSAHQNDCGPFPAVESHHASTFFFLLFLKRKKRLCVYSLQSKGLGCTDAAVWELWPERASNLQGSPGLCGEHPWAGLGGG